MYSWNLIWRDIGLFGRLEIAAVADPGLVGARQVKLALLADGLAAEQDDEPLEQGGDGTAELSGLAGIELRQVEPTVALCAAFIVVSICSMLLMSP